MSESRPERLPRVHAWLLGGTLAGALLWRVLPAPPPWIWLALPGLLAAPNLRRGAGSLRLGLALLLLFWLTHGTSRGDSRPPAGAPDPRADGSRSAALLLRPLADGSESLSELRRQSEDGPPLRRPLVCAAWARQDSGWQALPGRLEVWPREGRCPPLRSAGAWLLVRQAGHDEPLWEPFRPPLAPHAPDRRAQAWSRGRCGRLGLDTTRVQLRALTGVPPVAPPGWGARLRAWCARRLFCGSGTGGPWLVAVLLGETAWLPPYDVAVWQETGLAHLLAVSGLNVGVLALTLGQGLGPLPVPGFVRDLLLAGLLGLYVPLAGNQVSVERAVGMALLLLAARRLGRPLGGLSVLALAASTALWLDPGELVRPGFQMSYGAVAGLLLGMGAGAPPVAGRLRRGLRVLGTALRVTVAAQAGTLLTQLACFGVLPLSGVLLNLAAVPLSSALTVGGFLHLWLPLPGEPLGALNEVLAGLIVWLARRTPVLSLSWDPHPLQQLLLGLALAALLWPGSRRRWSWPLAAGLTLVAAALLPALDRPRSIVCLLDVGQGDALLLRSPAGRAVLVDAGWSNPFTPDRRGAELARALGRLHAGPLDWLVLTHPDQDHLGGAAGLLAETTVRRVLWNGEWKANAPQDSLRAQLARRALPLVEARPGQWLQLEPGWRLGVLGPPPHGHGLEGNERSIVLRLETHRDTLLFTGDMGYDEEQRLADWGPWWRAGTLKLGHHGSRGSSSPELLESVAPRRAWISCGRGNRYGHPHPTVLARLSARGASIWRTDRQGWHWQGLEAGVRPARAFPRPRLRWKPAAGPP